MVDRVKVAEDADRPEDRPEDQKRQLPPGYRQLFPLPMLPQKQGKRDGRGDQVAEKALLDAGQVAGKPDKAAHQREAEGGGEDTEDPFGAVVHGNRPFLF